ncbi:hypothetical protein [Methylohalobius crimeensis]|uniref:hypothetical protein n=1 Tax=Methylohalobius crimeensis TaxID=244365 RepID=UPI00041605F1|nr:hypothetical protein [Methylohalobius crimeensis]
MKKRLLLLMFFPGVVFATPGVNLISPGDDEFLTVGATIFVQWESQGVESCRVEFPGGVEENLPSSGVFISPELSESGPGTVTVSCENPAGQTVSDSASFTVQPAPPGPNPLVDTYLSPDIGMLGEYNPMETVQVSWEVDTTRTSVDSCVGVIDNPPFSTISPITEGGMGQEDEEFKIDSVTGSIDIITDTSKEIEIICTNNAINFRVPTGFFIKIKQSDFSANKPFYVPGETIRIEWVLPEDEVVLESCQGNFGTKKFEVDFDRFIEFDSSESVTGIERSAFGRRDFVAEKPVVARIECDRFDGGTETKIVKVFVDDPTTPADNTGAFTDDKGTDFAELESPNGFPWHAPFPEDMEFDVPVTRLETGNTIAISSINVGGTSYWARLVPVPHPDGRMAWKLGQAGLSKGLPLPGNVYDPATEKVTFDRVDAEEIDGVYRAVLEPWNNLEDPAMHWVLKEVHRVE